MSERPIIFSGAMVRAILAGSKSQTRRVLKPQPDGRRIAAAWNVDGVWCWRNGHDGSLEGRIPMPYQPGDRLWIRETWGEEPERLISPGHGEPTAVMPGDVFYRADDANLPGMRWRPSIHMPKAYARIWLDVTAVRVERLQDISEDDARAEGVADGGCLNCGSGSYPEPCGCGNPKPDFRDSFAFLWNAINARRPGCSWDANPWVAAIEFGRAG